MYKMLFILLNIINLFKPIYQEAKENIIYEDDFYIGYEENKELVIKTKNDEWIRKIDLLEVDIFNIDNNLFIFSYVDNKLKVLVYNRDGLITLNKEILSESLVNYKIFYYDKFYIIGSIDTLTNQIDALMYIYDIKFNLLEKKNYGGRLNDYFFELVKVDDKLILAGKKDNLTGGDFGNGGKHDQDIFLCLIDNENEIEKVVVLNDNSKIIGLKYIKDDIILVSENAIYKFNQTLDLIKSNEINLNSLYFTNAYNNKILVFSFKKITVYDLISLKKMIEIPIDIGIEKIKEFNNILYINDKLYFDLANLENIKYAKQVYKDITPVYDVSSIFGSCEFLEEVSEEYFSNLIFGKYQRSLKYKNIYGLEFIIDFESVVQIEVNVTQGGIYPVGYRLFFTGNGYLNNTKILNNYELTKAGDYLLKLVGKDNEEYEVSFQVSDKQVYFEDDIFLNYDVITKKNEPYYLHLKYSDSLSNIHSVIIDNEEYFDLVIDLEKKLLSIKMKPLSDSGVLYHIINGIIYNDEIYRSVSVEKVYVVKVLEDVPNYTVIKESNSSYLINFSEDSVSRFFYVYYTFNGEEIIQKYPLNSSNIILMNLPESLNIKFGVSYDLGDKTFFYFDLIEFTYEMVKNNNILEVELVKSEEESKEFRLKVKDEKALKSVVIGEKIAYENIKKNYLLQIIIGIISFIMVTSFLINFRIKKTKKSDIN